MKIINFLKNFIVSLYASLKRFPIAIGLCVSASVLLMLLTNIGESISSETREIIERIVMIVSLGVPVSLCTKLVFERKVDIHNMVKAAVYVVEALGLLLYYFFLLRDFEMVAVTRYIGLSLSFYMAFIFIPYFYRRDGFELYVVKLMTRFFTAALYSIVLFLGIAAILFTVDELLGIKVIDEVYLDVWLGVAGIFAPSFFLAGVPLYEEQLSGSTYPKLLKVLLLYIVMPIISVYTAILYIYFAKIIVTLQWPAGLVAHLVLWYSAICAVIIFLIAPFRDGNKWAGSFSFLLPKLIIPLIIMMFFSIGIRVRAYGITENRYYVILLGLWVLGVMLYASLAKVKRNIILPVSLSIMAFLSVIGPWSSFSVSMFSQNERLEDILMKYGMLKGNSIVKTEQAVSVEDKKEISEILSYFSRSHTLSNVRYLPKDFEMNRMKEIFGFPNTAYSYRDNAKVHVTYNSNMAKNTMDIRGYSYMLHVNGYDQTVKSLGNDADIRYDNDTDTVIIRKNGKEIYKRALLDYGKQINGKYGNEDKYAADPNELSFVDENESIKVKYIFNHVDVYRVGDSEDINVSSMNFYMLIEFK